MVDRSDVQISAEGCVTLAAWLYRPGGLGPHPAVTMAQGFGGIKEQLLDPIAGASPRTGSSSSYTTIAICRSSTTTSVPSSPANRR
jgi:hypothetical protein